MLCIQFFRRRVFLLTVALHAVAGYAQSKPTTSYPSLLPYSFSNFVWWTDDELRVDLKKKIPGLRDEIAPNLAAEGKLPGALIALLAERGVHAEVQIQDPPPSSFTSQRAPGAPAPSIVFKITSPDVLVNKVVVPPLPPRIAATLQESLQRTEGREYASGADWLNRSSIKDAFETEGYLEAQTNIAHSAPIRTDGTYKIDLLISVDPGPQYHIAEITADGGPLLEGRDLSHFYTSKVGETAVRRPFGRLAGEVRALYWQAGYSDVEMSGSPVLDRYHATASYHFKVNPGPLYYLHTLTIHNLTPTQEDRVTELLSMKPGDVFNEMAINTLSRRLQTEPLTEGLGSTFSPKNNSLDATTDLTLDFFKSGKNATVSVH